MIRRKKKRQEKEEALAAAAAAAEAKARSEKSRSSRIVSGMYPGSDSAGSADDSGFSGAGNGNGGMGFEKHLPFYPPASDDPEHDTEGFEPQFSTRLVPRQHLRVMNPEPGASGS